MNAMLKRSLVNFFFYCRRCGQRVNHQSSGHRMNNRIDWCFSHAHVVDAEDDEKKVVLARGRRESLSLCLCPAKIFSVWTNVVQQEVYTKRRKGLRAHNCTQMHTNAQTKKYNRNVRDGHHQNANLQHFASL